ncbi:dihydrofolate reductase family protein [Streptacidiphilus monticola]|uniref:Dihydrofolate reductase family protein n=1 Tax=Streptacidiphilus monticola TaxID=2161674 RepID=A0ABW1G5Z0_9ACTN
MSVIAIAFTTLDGVAEDPDGSAGSGPGPWMFRYGREAVGGDAFRLGRLLDDGVLLLGRGTWQHFARLWPNRDDAFASRMNAADKLVASRTLTEADAAAWANSRVLQGDLLDAVKRERRDVLVMGSLDIAHRLAAADLVDEYRLLTFPVVLGRGRRIFPENGPVTELDCVQVELDGPLIRTRYRRSTR